MGLGLWDAEFRPSQGFTAEGLAFSVRPLSISGILGVVSTRDEGACGGTCSRAQYHNLIMPYTRHTGLSTGFQTFEHSATRLARSDSLSSDTLSVI